MYQQATILSVQPDTHHGTVQIARTTGTLIPLLILEFTNGLRLNRAEQN